jgi:hypothetical protein
MCGGRGGRRARALLLPDWGGFASDVTMFTGAAQIFVEND